MKEYIPLPRDCRDGDTKRGDVGLIKVKNKLTLTFILGDLKHFSMFFPLMVLAGWVRTFNGKFHYYFFVETVPYVYDHSSKIRN